MEVLFRLILFCSLSSQTLALTNEVEALLHKAKHALEQEQMARAFDALSYAYDLSSELESQKVEVLAALGYFYFRLGSRGDSEGCYKKAINLDPYHFNSLMGLGDVLFTRKEFLNARHSYEMAKKYHPNRFETYSAIASTFYERAQTSQAFHYYQLALEKNPDDTLSLNNLGILWYERRNLREAQRTWESGLRENPDSISLHNNLGILFRDAGQPEKARVHFLKALKIRGEDPAVLSNYANLLFDKRRTEQAKHYLRLAQKQERSPVYFNNLAVMERFTREVLGSGTQFGHALRERPDYSNAKFHSRYFEGRSQKIKEANHR